MDYSERKITKIARAASSFVLMHMKNQGVGPSEFDFLHVIRKNPGITQAGIREKLSLDKAAAARRTMSLERKGYLIRVDDPEDRRCKRLYATDKAEALKNSKAHLESVFYSYLLSALTAEELEVFLPLLDRIYKRSKEASLNSFSSLSV